MHLRFRFLVPALLVISGYAQTTGAKLTGLVLDAAQAPIPEAKLRLTARDTGLLREAVTNEAGLYLIPNLPVGTYRLEVSKPDLQTAVVPELTVDVYQSVTLNLTLKVGSVSESVTVSAEGNLLDSESSQLGAVITREKVTELPLSVQRTRFSGHSFVYAATAYGPETRSI